MSDVIYIDLPADLNMEDDEGRNVARLSDAVNPDHIATGSVLVAGAPGGWSWVLVEEIEEGFVYFRQISGSEAGRRAPLVTPLPQSV